MDKKDVRKMIIDRLKRAYEMEEKMVIIFIKILDRPSAMKDIPENIRTMMHKTLRHIRKDTIRHKNIVKSMLNKIRNA